MTEGRKDTLVAVAKKLMGRCWRPPPADWLSTFYLCSACKHLERRDVLLLLGTQVGRRVLGPWAH